MRMSHKPAIASLSVGRAGQHSLLAKLPAAAAAGFTGIEAFYEDIELHASRLSINSDAPDSTNSISDSNTTPGQPSEEQILEAARDFKRLASNNGLTVICLQPFMHHEGLVSESERQKRWTKLQLWFRIARILDTDIMQIPSNFLKAEEIIDDREVIVRDLQKLADAGAQQSPPIRFAYENVCWGTFINKWRQLWEIVQRVDRPNFGMCLDTFHLCGGEWADPASDTGTVDDDADQTFAESMREMVRTIDVNKVFYIQVADAQRSTPPMRADTGNKWWVDGQQPRMTWSRNMRVFAFEEDGYMPVDVALQALLDPPPNGLGYKGWVSMEVFSWTLAEKDRAVPEHHAERAKKSWEAISRRLKLTGKVES